MRRFIFLIVFSIFSKSVSPFGLYDSIIIYKPKALLINKNLKIVLQKLNQLKNDKLEKNKTFTILHIGDSHVQGDFFSGEIRRQLQSYFGFAGIGAIFPYSLAKSYGPRGLVSKSEGNWNSYKILSPRNDFKLGLLGYGLTTQNENASIHFEIKEKFPILNFTDLNIWHTYDSSTFNIEINNKFQSANQYKSKSGWAVSNFKSKMPQKEFNFVAKKNEQNQHHFEFLGFELLNENTSGINYHHLGVVGAQFTHFIKYANFNLEQIVYLKPDLIIFSFGTNEAYDNSFDSVSYYNITSSFIKKLIEQLSETGIIFTTAPDTRSMGKTPPFQISVNNQLKKIANEYQLTIFDLNTEMGGWGSLYNWQKYNLTLKDKLHFTSSGYSLQGKLFSLSLLDAYNKVNFKDTINISLLQDTIIETLTKVLSNDTKNTIKNETKTEIQILPEKKFISKNKIHVIKKGDTIGKLSNMYHISKNSIFKINHINQKTILNIGQKIIIPKKN